MNSFGKGRKALLEVSAGCNSDCIFCLRNKIRVNPNPLRSIDQEKLKAFLCIAARFQMQRVEIGGDEPTVLPAKRLLEIVRLCSQFRFDQVALISNGIALGERRYARDLFEAGANVFILPLYGATGDVHDAIVQREGGFEKVCRAIGWLNNWGAKILLHTLVLRQNESQLSEIRALARRWKLPLTIRSMRIRDSHIDYRGLVPKKQVKPSKESAIGSTLVMRYKLFASEMDFDMDHQALKRLLRIKLQERGVNQARAWRALENMDRNPFFRDPIRLNGLLGALSSSAS